MALTKAEIVNQLSKEVDIQQQNAKDLVDSFFEEMRELLESGHPVKLSGFGNFDLRDKKARPGRNPKTGQVVEVSGRRVLTFKSGQKLKKIVGE